MEITKEMFKSVVENAFAKNVTETMNAFINAYNQNHNYGYIYNIEMSGQFGLQGFVDECGVDIQDLGDICKEYDSDRKNRFYVYNSDGFYVSLYDVIDKYIDRVFVCKKAMMQLMAETKQFYTIMDTTQSHNPELVNKINHLWMFGDKQLWMNILNAIAMRDQKELEDKGIRVLFPSDAYDLADQILMNVCDDIDLEMIINYIRY